MKGILIVLCILIIICAGFRAMKELSKFILSNRRGRSNYEYFYPDEEED